MGVPTFVIFFSTSRCADVPTLYSFHSYATICIFCRVLNLKLNEFFAYCWFYAKSPFLAEIDWRSYWCATCDLSAKSGLKGKVGLSRGDLAWYSRYFFCIFLNERERGKVLHEGLSKNYVVKLVGMQSTRFSVLAETLFSSESSWTPETQPNDALRSRMVPLRLVDFQGAGNGSKAVKQWRGRIGKLLARNIHRN